jgi:multidrug efflux pump subunit AcrA (membrane-fusion protein)
MAETSTVDPDRLVERAPAAPPLVAPPRGPVAPPRPAASRPPAPPAHRPRQGALLALVALLLLSGAGWWILTAVPWTTPPGRLAASGTLEADEVLVGFEVPGRLVELAREGDSVRRGETIARLDDALIQLQIRQAEPAMLQQLRVQEERYQLQAPIGGVVTRVPMHVGEVVSAGQTVAALADLSALKLTVYVLERDLGQVQVGQAVSVTADPFPGRTFPGVVTSTNPRAEFTPRNVQTQRDRLNLVFGVKVRVDNPDWALKPGMPADATFEPLP